MSSKKWVFDKNFYTRLDRWVKKQPKTRSLSIKGISYFYRRIDEHPKCKWAKDYYERKIIKYWELRQIMSLGQTRQKFFNSMFREDFINRFLYEIYNIEDSYYGVKKIKKLIRNYEC